MSLVDQFKSVLREERKTKKVTEQDVEASDVIEDLIDQPASQDNDDQGQTVQLLRGLAFSDQDKANEFMRRLMDMINNDNFGDLASDD